MSMNFADYTEVSSPRKFRTGKVPHSLLTTAHVDVAQEQEALEWIRL